MFNKMLIFWFDMSLLWPMFSILSSSEIKRRIVKIGI